MANRLGRSFYRFSSVNRPGPPPVGPTTDTTRDSTAQYDGGRQFASMIPKDQPATEPSSPRRTYSPVRESLPPSPTYSTKKAASPRRPPHSPTRESLPTSPTFSTKKAASPPSSPTYRPTSSRPITSPPKPLPEYSPKFKQTHTQTQPRSPPEADRKPVIYKSVEKSTKSDRHLDSGKSSHNNKQQPNAIRIAGENIGAVMEIVQSPNKREGGGHIIRKKETRGIHHNNVGHENDEASKEKGSRKGKEANDNNTLPTSTFMNSNFQTVNNSLLYNASINHHDPGLHLSFSRKPTRNRSSIEEEKKHFES